MKDVKNFKFVFIKLCGYKEPLETTIRKRSKFNGFGSILWFSVESGMVLENFSKLNKNNLLCYGHALTRVLRTLPKLSYDMHEHSCILQ